MDAILWYRWNNVQFRFKKILYQVRSMRWRSIFCYSRKELLTQMLPIVGYTMVIPCREIKVDTMTFLDIWFIELSKFSSRKSDFFFFTRYATVLEIYRKFESEIFFVLPNHFFDHTDVTFKYFSKGGSVAFSSVSSPLTHLWCFQALELLKVLFFSPFFSLMTDWFLFFVNCSWC